jgi:hypothetical protein
MRFLAVVFALVAMGARAEVATVPPWGIEGDKGSRGEDLVVRLVTFGQGDDVTEWFGHSALVVEDTAKNVSLLYNYGEFAFSEDTVVRYVLGRLEFHVGARSVERTLLSYRAHNRSILIQDLDLDPDERLSLARFLANNARPENATYLYDHYTDNCATRPRDVVDAAVHGQLRAASKPGRMTLRQHTRRMTQHAAWLSVPIDMALNGEVDRPITTWDEAFLPGELAKQVGELVVTRADGSARPLVKESRVWFEANRAPPPDEPAPTWPPLVATGVALAAALLVVRRRRAALGALVALTGLVFGGAGTVLFLMWTITDHMVAHHNENLFVMSPVTLLLLPLGLAVSAGKRGAVRALYPHSLVLLVIALVDVAGKLTPWLPQKNAPFLALMLPILVALVVAARTQARALDVTPST